MSLFKRFYEEKDLNEPELADLIEIIRDCEGGQMMAATWKLKKYYAQIKEQYYS